MSQVSNAAGKNKKRLYISRRLYALITFILIVFLEAFPLAVKGL